MNSEFDVTPADDLLDGGEAYADYTGFPKRRCYHLLQTGRLPGGKLSSKWIGSKQAVRDCLARLTSTEAA